MVPNMERRSPAAATAPTTAARWLRARATSALANAAAAARTAAAAARTASAAATTAATTAARAALPTVGPSSPVLVPVTTPAAADGDEDDWHLVTEEDLVRPCPSAPDPSGPPETEEELSRKWHSMKPRLDAAIRAGDVEKETAWRLAMSKVNRRMAPLQKARVERERRRAAEAERERPEAANPGWKRELLRGMGAMAFRKPSEEKEEEGKPPENSFYREDEDQENEEDDQDNENEEDDQEDEDEDEESAEACVSKDEREDEEEDEDPAVWEDALDER